MRPPITNRAIVVVADVGALRSQPGPSLFPTYCFVLSLGAVYAWTPNSQATDAGTDTSTAVVPLTGGFEGAWLRQWLDDEALDPLGNADATLTVDQGLWLTLPAGTLAANHTLTLSTTNAAPGAYVEVTRLDTSGNTFTLVNGGQAGGTVCVMPAGSRSNALAWFDGANFLHRRSGLML